jgi:hypothetical protein
MYADPTIIKRINNTTISANALLPPFCPIPSHLQQYTTSIYVNGGSMSWTIFTKKFLLLMFDPHICPLGDE